MDIAAEPDDSDHPQDHRPDAQDEGEELDAPPRPECFVGYSEYSIVTYDDGCYHKDDRGNSIRKKPENQMAWANGAVDNGASYNHLQDDLYCYFFNLPGDDMLAALGSAAVKCHE